MLQKMQDWSDILNMANVGYDKNDRWSFLDMKKRTIKWDKECDCSSSCGAIAWLAGYPAHHNRRCSWGLNPPVSSSDLAM